MLIENCKACELYKTRTNIVNGKGNNNADFVLIGEGPGAEEDEQGIPFVGRSGGLIDEALDTIGITRDDIYISNIVKCRPPGNRNPVALEIETCLPYLMGEILIVKPRVICLLGKVAAQVFIPGLKAITKQEGKIYNLNGIKAIPICHPSYYLRNYAPKQKFFNCIKKAYESSLA
jgi:DNA polymerase